MVCIRDNQNSTFYGVIFFFFLHGNRGENNFLVFFSHYWTTNLEHSKMLLLHTKTVIWVAQCKYFMTPKKKKKVTIKLPDCSVRFPGTLAGSECKYYEAQADLCVSAQLDKNLVTSLVSWPLEKDYLKKTQPNPLLDQDLRQFHCSILQLKQNILLVMAK